MASACPFTDCGGNIHALKLSGGFNAFGCDQGQHQDSAIRHALMRECDDAAADCHDEMTEQLRRCDPVFWVREQVIEAQNAPDVKFQQERLGGSTALPTFATGFIGRERGTLLELRGMVTLSGRASSGKSWFAIGAALNSAIDGWDAHFVAAEGEDVIRRRVAAAYGDQPPARFRLHSVKPGVTVKHMIQEIADWIVSTRTLLVIDSISTLMGLMTVDSRANRWDEQGKLEIFLMRLRELTRGEVAVLILSEANAAGETKGRTLDHKSDISINFKNLEDSDAKEIRVVKAWEGPTGLVGRARVKPSGPGLELIHEGPRLTDDFETTEF
jgi:KaiC/GvpD/RAD55 family RecA-like ATPase